LYFAKKQQPLGNFATTERLQKFVHGIASGLDNNEAYLKYYTKKPIPKRTAIVQASKLLMKPIVQDMLKVAQEQRALAIKQELAKAQRQLAKEFIEKVLTVDELDSFHSSVIQGLVDVEEFVPVYTVEEILNSEGKVVKRIRKPGLLPTRRKPNIREKQVSVDALYKRFGNYAPGKMIGAFGNVGDDGEIENVKRFIIMASGERVPMP
jgi:hypothetical protein